MSARSTWKTSIGTWSVEAGETVFFRKGAFVLPPHFEENLCILIFFIPDGFVRETVRELAAHLQSISRPLDAREPVIRVNNDMALSAFFQSMLVYFAGDEEPPEALLKLKLKELLTSILVSPGNPTFLPIFARWRCVTHRPFRRSWRRISVIAYRSMPSQRCAIAAFPRSSGSFADAMGPLRQSG